MYLLDTHTLLWWLDAPENLSREAYNLLYRKEEKIFISPLNSWEIMIKHMRGKLPLSKNYSIKLLCEEFDVLSLGMEETFLLKSLPFHHKDPFDRMLVAQAMAHKLIIITRDPNIPRYGVAVLRA